MFKIQSSLICCAALLLCGCQREQNRSETGLQEQPSIKKPLVAVVPMMDHSKSNIPWSLSEELSSLVYEKLSQAGDLYLLDPRKTDVNTRRLKENQNPFGADISWVKKSFPQNEFVVFLELVEHEEIPSAFASEDMSKDISSDLNMIVRIRVFDVRGLKPSVVLQELVQHTHHLPRQFTQANFVQVPWGDEMYAISPLGMAHSQLTQEIAKQVEDYILMAARR